MIPPIGAVNYDIYNPYSMYGMSGMGYGMGMCGMGMVPQNLEQYRNMRKVTSDIYTDQISFAGKINPFLGGFSNSERTNTIKAVSNYSADMRNIFSPYSKENLGATKDYMSNISQLQMQMMASPFSIYGGGALI